MRWEGPSPSLTAFWVHREPARAARFGGWKEAHSPVALFAPLDREVRVGHREIRPLGCDSPGASARSRRAISYPRPPGVELTAPQLGAAELLALAGQADVRTTAIYTGVSDARLEQAMAERARQRGVPLARRADRAA